MQETLLILHVIAASAWLGGALLTQLVAPRFAQAGGDAALTWARLASGLSVRFFNPAAIITLLTGIGLVLNTDAYGWADTFVSIGLGVIVVAAILGIGVLAPASRNLVSAMETGDFGSIPSAAKRVRAASLTILLLVLLTVVVMVLKTGAGG